MGLNCPSQKVVAQCGPNGLTLAHFTSFPLQTLYESCHQAKVVVRAAKILHMSFSRPSGNSSENLAACVPLHAADKCAQSTLCTEITDAIWSGLLSDLTSYGQGSANAAWTDYLISAINTTFSVLDPKVSPCPMRLLWTLFHAWS